MDESIEKWLESLGLDESAQSLNETPQSDFSLDEGNSKLIEQFNSFNVTDHDDILEKFYDAVSFKMDHKTAAYFLKLSDWNCAEALRLFEDYCDLLEIPSMRIIHHRYKNAGQQVWRIINDGQKPWPNRCYLVSCTQAKEYRLPMLKPYETCDIVADIREYNVPVMWRACTFHGSHFGERIFIIPRGRFISSAAVAECKRQLLNSEESDEPNKVPQINLKIKSPRQSKLE